MPRDLLAEVEAPAGRDLLAAVPERSLGEQALRAVGRTARAGIEESSKLVGAAANAPAAIYNKIANFMSPPTLAGQITGERGFRFPDQANFGKVIADKIGLPGPENQTERVAGDVAGAMLGGGGLAKVAERAASAASPLVRRIGEVLASNQGAQIIGSGTGTGAASATREAGGGPVAQIAAGVAGGLSPALPTLIKAATRKLARGGESFEASPALADTIKAFEDAGAGVPTVGQATQGRGARALESTLSRTPGAAGRIVKKAEEEAAGMGAKVEDMAAQLAAKSGAAPAGRQIKGGLEHFVDDFKEKSGLLYDQLDNHIQKDTRIKVENTQKALAELNAPIPGAPKLSKYFQSARMKGIEGALESDTAGDKTMIERLNTILAEATPDVRNAATLQFDGGKLPYEALKKLRTLVGQEISNSSLVSDVPRSKWKALYGALSKDLGAAAREAGPEAEQAMVRASNHYRAGMKRIEDVLHPIVGKGDPEDIFKAATSGTKEGATTLQGVMKSLPEESRKVVTATALRRLGLATPGKQNELGEVFSTETFLTNWNKLHPDAKRVLFAPMPEGMRADLDKIAKVAANVREGSKVFANPSGTAQALSTQHTVGGAVLSTILGHPGVAAGIAGAMVGANATARLVTNPAVVRWLAQSTRVPIEQLPAQLNILSQATWNMRPEDRHEVQGLIATMREAESSAGKRNSQ